MRRLSTIGWDLGGVHLKAAYVDAGGSIAGVIQIPCALRDGLGSLTDASERVLRLWPNARRHCVTMTGELCDRFSDRRQGVVALVEHMSSLIPRDALGVYAGHYGLVSLADYRDHLDDIASANWLASAALLAARASAGLLVDVGSTTVDIVPFAKGRVLARGRTDAERLSSGELVYTGAVRTPVCAVAGNAPFNGQWQRLTAELFSTMADVYRILDWLPENADQLATADGRGKSVAESIARLARMLGRDAGDGEREQWRLVAAYLARRQQALILDAIDQVRSRAALGTAEPIVGAGAGRFLIERLCVQAEAAYVDFGALCAGGSEHRDAAALCAPAVALALAPHPQAA